MLNGCTRKASSEIEDLRSCSHGPEAIRPRHFFGDGGAFANSGGKLSPRLAAAARVVMNSIGSPPPGGDLTIYTSLPSGLARSIITRRISLAGLSFSSRPND